MEYKTVLVFVCMLVSALVQPAYPVPSPRTTYLIDSSASKSYDSDSASYSQQKSHVLESTAYSASDSYPVYGWTGKSFNEEPTYAPVPYRFEYSVNDETTYDIKTHSETSDGHGHVTGFYSLVEPDGTKRIVEYTADENGFNAVVRKEGIARHNTDFVQAKVLKYGSASAPVYSPVPDYSSTLDYQDSSSSLQQSYTVPNSNSN